ncbi:hypothetical protein PR202_ga21885 [Eleusine coracana subsp. coracana]|uniref:Reverse transcriptase zinc-binding domain-containing protein n=1 Tax=Eleusine coracana subsp. coracana TaxID=191504 RepID=A0AAV5D2H7_ELECO|nr:hypothetical protein PR202_ga21885 [Eleusine coracana subsp. coracana]
MATEIGDGTNTLFWKDRWLLGQRIEDLSPVLASMVPGRFANRRTVNDAISNMAWIRDIHGEATPEVIAEFLKLCDIIDQVELQPDTPDRHTWRFSTSGQYTAKSAYDTLFLGSVPFEPWERVWKSWAPGKCHFFLWLAVHRRCWTADRLR